MTQDNAPVRNTILTELVTSLRCAAVSLLICGVAYPFLIFVFAQGFTPWTANGSLLANKQGRIIGSALIAQGFSRPEYFWPRPSAVDYNAAATGGSNLSPANPKVADRARGIIERYGLHEGQRIPADLVTASGSGMDPHITLEAARLQIPRVATARGVTTRWLENQIADAGEMPLPSSWGGQPLINVLKLNLALDHAATNAGQ
jgi:K+-transporting ATPase ATPase C chain